ncbi:MAG: hypothetical protein HFF97_03050 [Oscillibacter sp.]|jgi:hypothetical protein|uniref:hypothetical protein n=1 Tax=uncultured Oscillibacter sp. TaxID=876091 RepID=UPI00216DD9F7|nr:hypothetical protein [uncultured Oscillibacter sp.]MCI9643690.1 hypothetical protein [Oscillibacter sp.]
MSYKELYLKLFSGMTDALAALQSGQVLSAMHILLRASEAAEAARMEADILPDVPLE